jgi:hypothetical protein
LNSAAELKVERILNLSREAERWSPTLRIGERTDLRFFRTERKLRSRDEVLLCRALPLDVTAVVINFSRERDHACEIKLRRGEPSVQIRAHSVSLIAILVVVSAADRKFMRLREYVAAEENQQSDVSQASHGFPE